MKTVVLISSLLLWTGIAHAYDATFIFTHPLPASVQAFRIKYGPTKGGPYSTVIPCGKPAPKADGTYECKGTGINLDPLYAVAVAVDTAGQESPPSNEAMYDPPPLAPGELRYIISGTITLTPAP